MINSGEGVIAGSLTYSISLNGKVLYKNPNPIKGKNYFVNITDMKELVEDKNLVGYGGTWELSVYADYDCLLEEFSLDVSALLDPLDSDTDNDGISDGDEINPELNDGWITNPKFADTDGDGWSDYKEIYETMSNPLSRDSDADGAIDSTDIDPLHNVIIEVKVKNAKMHDSSVAEHLQVVIRDRTTDNAIFTTQNRKSSRRSTWNDKFYFDIDDDRRTFRINCELYDVNKAAWDTNIMDKSYNYDRIAYDLSRGNSRDVRLENSAGNYVEFRLKPIRLSRVNTIAVYENGTFSHGRYNSQEKMTMIQLDICPVPDIFDPPDPIEIPEESPFTNGANVIIIPSSVFSNSKLNAVIQQAVGPGESVNWGAVPNCLKNKKVTLRIGFFSIKVDTTEFIGLDRSDPDESVSDWIEMTIVKRYCSLKDAEAILELALTTEINETTHEEALTYLHNSTKWHTELELSPERMNLHKDILKIIPLDGAGYRNARQGPKPEEFDDYVHRLVSNFINLIKGLIMAIGRFIANIVKAIIKIGLSILAVMKEALMVLIEALLKAALLAFIYLEFTLFVAGMTIAFAAFYAALIFITLIYGGSLILNGFTLEYIKNNQNIIIWIDIFWKYNSFLDVDIPKSTFLVAMNQVLLFEISSGIIESSLETINYGAPASDWMDIPPEDRLDPWFIKPCSLDNGISGQEFGDSTQEGSSIDQQWITYTDYGATLVGGYKVIWDKKNNVHDILEETDNDGIPFNYDIDDNTDEWAKFKDASGDDDDEDGLDDDDEDGLDDDDEERYNCHYLAPDSDFDGLEDGWEINNADYIESLEFEPFDRLDPSKPDVIIEVDYFEGWEPTSKEISLFYSITEIIIASGGIAFATAAFLSRSSTATLLLLKITYYFIINIIILKLFRPRDPFLPLKRYFYNNGINLHIIIDDEPMDTNIEDLEGFYRKDYIYIHKKYFKWEGIDYYGLDVLESHYHDIPQAIHALFVCPIYYSDFFFKFPPGISAESFGIAMTRFWWANPEQKVLGHELGHCLGILEHEKTDYGVFGGYEPNPFNYMSGAYPGYFQFYGFYNWQWCSFDLNYKWNAVDV